MNNQQSQPQTAIFRIRERSGISQRQLAVLAGIDRVALRLWENEGKEPRLKPSQVAALIKVLKCELSDLIDYDQQQAA